jgi:hypothetical protein
VQFFNFLEEIMPRLKFLLAIISISWVPLANASSQVLAEGVNVAYSCGYFSAQAEHFHITYSNADPSIPAPTQMFLHWGLAGYMYDGYNGSTPVQKPIDWSGGRDLPMVSTGPGKWEVTYSATTHGRTDSTFFNKIKFLVLQAQPGGTYYDPQGGFGHYYQVEFINNGGCVSGDQIPPMSPLDVSKK